MSVDLIAHAYGCCCAHCRAMAAAIAQQHAGQYFFTDAELGRLAERSAGAPCECALCLELHAAEASHAH